MAWIVIGSKEHDAIKKAFQEDVAWITDDKQRAAWVKERWRVFLLAREAIERVK